MSSFISELEPKLRDRLQMNFYQGKINHMADISIMICSKSSTNNELRYNQHTQFGINWAIYRNIVSYLYLNERTWVRLPSVDLHPPDNHAILSLSLGGLLLALILLSGKCCHKRP